MSLFDILSGALIALIVAAGVVLYSGLAAAQSDLWADDAGIVAVTR